MKKFLLLLLLSASTATFAQTATATDTNLPEITFEKTQWQFPEIPYASGFRKEFIFTNTGKSPLIISNAQTSCGCDMAEFPKDPILPGKTGKITYVYDSKRIGMFIKNCTVTSNAKTGTVVLIIRGSVAAPVEDSEPVISK